MCSIFSALGKFSPSDINPKLCTHLIYAFAVLDGENLSIKPGDNWLDVEKGHYRNFTDHKKKNTKLKTLISLGGWVDSNDNRESYNLVFNNDGARETFIKRDQSKATFVKGETRLKKTHCAGEEYDPQYF